MSPTIPAARFPATSPTIAARKPEASTTQPRQGTDVRQPCAATEIEGLEGGQPRQRDYIRYLLATRQTKLLQASESVEDLQIREPMPLTGNFRFPYDAIVPGSDRFITQRENAQFGEAAQLLGKFVERLITEVEEPGALGTSLLDTTNGLLTGFVWGHRGTLA